MPLRTHPHLLNRISPFDIEPFMLTLLSLLSGVALYISQPPRRAIWLQIPALFALLWACQRAETPANAATCGLIFALAYVAPQLLELRLHPAISAVLAVSQCALWTLIALGAAHFGHSNSLAAPFLVASLGAFLTWLEWSLLPLWGTAQSFARGWSSAPRLVQFVAFTGASGAAWCLFLLSALAVRLVLSPCDWVATLVAFLAVVGVLTALNFLAWKRERAAATLRVAAFGWGEGADFDRDLQVARAIREAGEQGAALLVLPEAAFQIEDRAAFRRTFGNLARMNKIALAIGYFDTQRNRNCTDFIDSSGEVQGRYVKTRLVPIFENYTRGTGETAGLEVEGARIGGLICQDDNFAISAARYGRARFQILAIPTHDWRSVKDFHAANSLWRALEFRLGLIKAASGGISVIASPRGEMLARCDHMKHGAQLLVAEMPVSSGTPTFYARAGDWFPIACGIAVFAALWLGAGG